MRKIGIVGASIERDELKKYHERYELWSVNNLYRKFYDIRFTKWFELHDIKCKNNRYSRRGMSSEYFTGQSINDHMNELNNLHIPIYMQRKWKKIKKSIKFPFSSICTATGNKTYYGCSFALMVGLAIKERVDEIAFFGSGLNGHEYYYQRASTEYMIGIAKGMGIKINTKKSHGLLCSNYVYALNENFDLIYMMYGKMASDLTHTIMTTIQGKIDNFFYNSTE